MLTPHSLILNHEGQKYLKLRPTSQPIICLLYGKQPKRNASLSQLEPLRQLIEARNQEIKKAQGEDPDDHGNTNLFDQQDPEPPAKKKQMAAPPPCEVNHRHHQKDHRRQSRHQLGNPHGTRPINPNLHPYPEPLDGRTNWHSSQNIA